MTSVSAERSFSAMKIIKTYLRNSMCQERLSSLAVIYIEKELTQKIDFEKVIDRFGSVKIVDYYSNKLKLFLNII